MLDRFIMNAGFDTIKTVTLIDRKLEKGSKNSGEE